MSETFGAQIAETFLEEEEDEGVDLELLEEDSDAVADEVEDFVGFEVAVVFEEVVFESKESALRA